MDRKYGQRGYMDNGGGHDRERERERDSERPREKPKGKPKGALRDVPRNVKMPGFQEVLRCSLCGVIVPPPVEIGFESQCPKCRADLHSCKNCRHFDTSAQFQCTQPITERIAKKDLRNQCDFFMARTSIERETREYGGGNGAGQVSPTKPADGRSAFDNLFKK